jgi:flagellar FliJ protein
VTRQFPLQSLLDLSQMRLDEATRQLGQLLASQEEAAQRLEVLISYRAEYEERYLAASRSGLGLESWQNYRAFLDRLDTAIDQARNLVAASERKTAAGQRSWLETRGKLKAFDTLAERHRARAMYAESRQQQKLYDEHAARKHGEEKIEE